MVGVAIPTFNWLSSLPRTINELIAVPEIVEITVLDDCSTDYGLGALYGTLLEGLRRDHRVMSLKQYQEADTGHPNSYSITVSVSGRDDIEVKVHQNKENVGAFENKKRVVELSSSQWILLIDSDNLVPAPSLAWLRQSPSFVTSELYHPEGHRRIIWGKAPLDTKPKSFFPKYSMGKFAPLGQPEFARLLSSSSWEGGYLLNNGNFLVNRSAYLRVAKSIPSAEVSAAGASDVVLFLKHWLDQEHTVRLVKDFVYLHGLREHSYWRTKGDSNSTGRLLEEISRRRSCTSATGARTLRHSLETAIKLERFEMRIKNSTRVRAKRSMDALYVRARQCFASLKGSRTKFPRSEA